MILNNTNTWKYSKISKEINFTTSEVPMFLCSINEKYKIPKKKKNLQDNFKEQRLTFFFPSWKLLENLARYIYIYIYIYIDR